jgi:hypothetical protein
MVGTHLSHIYWDSGRGRAREKNIIMYSRLYGMSAVCEYGLPFFFLFEVNLNNFGTIILIEDI